MYRTTKAHIRRRSAVAAVIAAGVLVIGGVASMAGASPRHGAGNNFGRPHGPGPRSQMHRHRGQVTTVTPTSITVATPRGVLVTYAVTSSTIITRDGAPSSLADVVVGDRAAIRPLPGSSTSAAAIDVVTPRLAGRIVSMSGNVITIASPIGLETPVAVTSSTTYVDARSRASASSLAAGTYIVALGTVASNHTTFDATSIAWGAPGAARLGGPGMAGRAGPGFSAGPRVRTR